MSILNRLRKGKGIEENETPSIENEISVDEKDGSDIDSIYSSIYDDTDEGIKDVYEEEEEFDIYKAIENDADECIEYNNIKGADGIKEELKGLASAGCNIVVTGCTGSGVTTIAYNTASALANLGYNTLIVDLDTVDRAQSYISQEMYMALGTDSLGLEQVVNSDIQIAKVVRPVKKNLYTIGLGAAVDAYSLCNVIKIEKLSEFMASAKAQFNFVVYDINIDDAIGDASNVATMADKLLLVIEATSSGAMKVINRITNIEKDVILHMIMGKSIPVLNKYIAKSNIMGMRLAKAGDIKKYMDRIICNLASEDIGIHFEDMRDAASIPYNTEYDKMWYEKGAYSCTKNGANTYIDLIGKII